MITTRFPTPHHSPVPDSDPRLAKMPLLTYSAPHPAFVVVRRFAFFPSMCAVLVIPVYLDAVTIVMGAIRNRIRKMMDKAGQEVRA